MTLLPERVPSRLERTLPMGRRRLYTIHDMRRVARERGGKCLSPHYMTAPTKLQWRCAKGHEWLATGCNVIGGRETWCARCSRKQPHTIEGLQEIAARRGGNLLSTTYRNITTNLRWRCAAGHEWEAIAKSVVRGTWCRRCAGKEPHTLAEMKALARSRGGRCLSKTYVNESYDLLWQCAKGHSWSASAKNVMHNESWCGPCAGFRKHTIEEMHELARKPGGRCLSTRYRGVDTPLRWECSKQHRFKARPRSIIDGRRWCLICRYGVREAARLGQRAH